jgi:hypothetical protein
VSADEAKPVLRIVNADTTPEEVAAIVAVFSALGSGGEAPVPRRTPEWSAPHRRVRQTFAAGPGGWRSSALPR